MLRRANICGECIWRGVVDFAKGKSHEGERGSSYKTELESIKKRKVEDPRSCETVRGRAGVEGVDGAKAKGEEGCGGTQNRRRESPSLPRRQ